MYAGMPISKVFEKNIGIGSVISLVQFMNPKTDIHYYTMQLWFRRRLPEYTTKFIEMVLMMTADHGPAVAGNQVLHIDFLAILTHKRCS